MDATQQLKQQIQEIQQQIKDTQALASSDPDMAEIASTEVKKLKEQQVALEASLSSLTATHESDQKSSESQINPNNATIEIRPGAGGDEAKIWADDLLRMYTRYFDANKIKYEALDSGILKLSGNNIYPKLKFESGVHRVQRVPETESQGRIHTSTASVAILPLIKPQQLEIKEEELEWQFVRSGGAGGQNVNKVNTAVRLTHKPSGITLSCSKERTQIRNREIALDLLRSQLWEIQEESRLGTIENQRRAAVGRAMRAEKIRTYNYPQNRVTDHRINKSWHNLESVMEGNIDDIVSTLKQTLSAN